MLQYRRLRVAARACVAAAATLLGAAAHAADPSPPPISPAGALLEWVRSSGDAGGRPFAIVDKAAARIHVYDGQGRLQGESPALLGSAPGDHTVPGVGLRTQAGTLRPEDRTTPAGRFDAQPGRNDKGEHVVWVDYDSAFAIHRLRQGFAFKARAERLAAAVAEQMRVSWGCVVVPVSFYERVVQPVLGGARSVVYVLPERLPLGSVFSAVEAL